MKKLCYEQFSIVIVQIAHYHILLIMLIDGIVDKGALTNLFLSQKSSTVPLRGAAQIHCGGGVSLIINKAFLCAAAL